ncbi:hypothetical protein ACROYT_G015186 [Oculina patagonica]
MTSISRKLKKGTLDEGGRGNQPNKAVCWQDRDGNYVKEIQDVHWLNFGWGEEEYPATGKITMVYHPDELWVWYSFARGKPCKEIINQVADDSVISQADVDEYLHDKLIPYVTQQYGNTYKVIATLDNFVKDIINAVENGKNKNGRRKKKSQQNDDQVIKKVAKAKADLKKLREEYPTLQSGRKLEQAKFKGCPKHPYKVHIWTRISKHGAMKVFLFVGNMDAKFYVKEILEQTPVPFIQEKFLEGHRFQQDNDPKHERNLAKNYLEFNEISW